MSEISGYAVGLNYVSGIDDWQIGNGFLGGPPGYNYGSYELAVKTAGEVYVKPRDRTQLGYPVILKLDTYGKVTEIIPFEPTDEQRAKRLETLMGCADVPV